MSDYSDFDDFKLHPSEFPPHTSPAMFPHQIVIPAPSPSPIENTKKMGSSRTSATDDVDSITNDFEHAVAVVDPVVLDSFLPLLESLQQPDLVEIIGGTYYLSGSVTEEASKKLSEFVLKVVKFTLSDGHPVHDRSPKPHIDNGTLFRILQLRSRHSQYSTPFFPSLKELRITDVCESFSQLSLFISSSLKSLEISNVEEVRYSQTKTNALLIFLRMLAKEAPSLSNLVMDDSIPFDSVARTTYTTFLGLRRLEIVVSDNTALLQKDLQDIGDLTSLEELVIDTSKAYYSQIRRPAPERSPGLLSEPEFSNLNAVPGVIDPWGKVSSELELSYHEDQPPTLLRVPSPTPSVPDIGDDDLDQQSSKLAIATFNEEPISSPITPRYRKLIKLHVRGELDVMKDLIGMISSTAAIAEMSLVLVKKVAKPVGPKKVGVKSNSSKPVKRAKPEPEPIVPPQIETPTAHFNDLIEDVLLRWTNSLLMLCAQATIDTKPIISLPTFRRLLSPLLQRVEVSGCTLNFDIGNALHYLTTVKRPSNLRVLHLPVDAGANGISFNRLRSIFECCPSLESFKCGFKHLSNIPALSVDGVTFGSLQTFAAGNPQEHDSRQRAIEVAQYLDALFPNLKVMETCVGCNTGQWEEIFSLVNMCQRSRSYHTRKA